MTGISQMPVMSQRVIPPSPLMGKAIVGKAKLIEGVDNVLRTHCQTSIPSASQLSNCDFCSVASL